MVGDSGEIGCLKSSWMKAQRILGVAFELAEEGGFDAVRLHDGRSNRRGAQDALQPLLSKKEMLVALG